MKKGDVIRQKCVNTTFYLTGILAHKVNNKDLSTLCFFLILGIFKPCFLWFIIETCRVQPPKPNIKDDGEVHGNCLKPSIANGMLDLDYFLLISRPGGLALYFHLHHSKYNLIRMKELITFSDICLIKLISVNQLLISDCNLNLIFYNRCCTEFWKLS